MYVCFDRLFLGGIAESNSAYYDTFYHSVVCPSVYVIQGVRNPMKLSHISFLKTELNQTDLKIQKPKTQFLQFGFQKTDLVVWGQFFTLSHSQHLPA